jgi:FKBP-type peptidyl-prolyl cis-trans isomerase SlyD
MIEMIEDKKFVSVSYNLYVEDDNEPWEEATAERPLNFTFGMGMMLQKFEDGLKGLKAGDTFDFTIACDDAYGAREDGRVVELDKSIFVVDGKFDSDYIKEGHIVPMMDVDGNRMNGVVLEVKSDKVVMDFNHPLAGEDLHFKGTVLEVRDATELEVAAAMNPQGHKCSGNCNGCGGGCGEHGDHDCDCHEDGDCHCDGGCHCQG